MDAEPGWTAPALASLGPTPPTPSIPHGCPLCNGAGHTSRPPNIPGDVLEWTTAGTETYSCYACKGSGVVWGSPFASSPDVALASLGEPDLEWLVANDASFGMMGGLQDDGTWLDKRFCRVPCRHLYEWHCYDGATWREALAAARASGPCIEDDEKGCTKARFGPGDQHPIRAKLEEMETALASLRSALQEARDERDGLRSSLRDTLAWHFLTGIECDHAAKTDVATCACALWRSDPQPSVGAAVERWAEHVIAFLSKKSPDNEKPQSSALRAVQRGERDT